MQSIERGLHSGVPCIPAKKICTRPKDATAHGMRALCEFTATVQGDTKLKTWPVSSRGARSCAAENDFRQLASDSVRLLDLITPHSYSLRLGKSAPAARPSLLPESAEVVVD